MSAWGLPVLMFAGSAFVCWALTFPAARVLSRRGVIDVPNERSSHTRPTIRGGGLAIVVTILVAGIGLLVREFDPRLLTLLAAVTVLAGVSFLDDIRSVPAAARLAVQAGAAVSVLAGFGSPLLQALSLPGGLEPGPVLGWLLLGLWLVGYTNSYNFMDGINGLAAGQAVVSGVGMVVLTGSAVGKWDSSPLLLCAAVAGAAAGFLPRNFPRAAMFMGDVGSAPLGFLLATLACWLAVTAAPGLFPALALLHANFVLDTGVTLARRVARGDQWHAAHREHFYQRLTLARGSHSLVTGWEMALQAVVLGLATTWLRVGPAGQAGLAAAIIGLWVAFFAYCERSHVRSSAR